MLCGPTHAVRSWLSADLTTTSPGLAASHWPSDIVLSRPPHDEPLMCKGLNDGVAHGDEATLAPASATVSIHLSANSPKAPSRQAGAALTRRPRFQRAATMPQHQPSVVGVCARALTLALQRTHTVAVLSACMMSHTLGGIRCQPAVIFGRWFRALPREMVSMAIETVDDT